MQGSSKDQRPRTKDKGPRTKEPAGALPLFLEYMAVPARSGYLPSPVPGPWDAFFLCLRIQPQ